MIDTVFGIKVKNQVYVLIGNRPIVRCGHCLIGASLPKIHANVIAAGSLPQTLPQTPLVEPTALSRPPSWILGSGEGKEY